ncbi:MAG: hypothetical protein RSE10_06580, partial [Oscillospiraceae bacterium]
VIPRAEQSPAPTEWVRNGMRNRAASSMVSPRAELSPTPTDRVQSGMRNRAASKNNNHHFVFIAL